MNLRVDVVSAVNNDDILIANLGASRIVQDKRVELLCQRGFSCAGKALNNGLDQATSDIVAFIHQDVYLPHTWLDRLQKSLEVIESENPNWAVIGVVGVNQHGSCVGRVWCAANGGMLGEPITSPTPVTSIDEVVIVLRRSSGLRFDETLPGFHLYGTDIVMEAVSRGHQAFAIDAPVIHNSRPIWVMPRAYWRAYRFMAQKWRSKTPIVTPCSTVSLYGWPRIEIQNRYDFFRSLLRGRCVWDGRIQDPERFATLHGLH